MNHTFFSPSSAELEALHKQLMKEIVSPLTILNKNRPGNPNTENALEITAVLSGEIQKAINNKAVINDEVTPSPSPSRPAAPAA
jgi:hypothetical protein